MATESDRFRKEDIFILLDAYKNQIESNRTLMEQQSKIIDQHSTILDKQKILADSLSEVIENINSSNIIVKNELIESRHTCFKDHTSIKTKIYIAYGGMLSIITSLIGLLYLLHEKNEVLKKVLEAVEKIIRHLRL